jgi:hypothetical protein
MRTMPAGSTALPFRGTGVAVLATCLLAACSSDNAEPTAGAPASSSARQLTAAEAASACAELADFDRDEVMISAAVPQPFSEQQGQGPGQPPLRVEVSNCKVSGTIDGSIKFELLLPDTWNGKFMMGGGGGFVGSVQNQAQEGMSGGATPLERGYATAGTDTGHTGEAIDASWALGNAEAKENFAHRAVHRTAEVSKALIDEYYGGEPERSYFFGCSRGGGQAMISAQRYPDDFDGIIAGAPVFDWPGTTAGFLRNQMAVFPDPNDLSTPVITADNRKLVADALTKACDGLDGVEDGVFRDPRRCEFDPTSLPLCTAEPAADCLTEPQLAAIQTVYRGPIAGGSQLHPGFPLGGEADPQGWNLWITQMDPPVLPPGVPNLHYAFGTQFAKYFVFDDPSWTYANFDLADWRQRTAAVGQLLNATNPDLSKFRDGGGKLILWHGWSDSALTALTSIEYYEAVQRTDDTLRGYFKMYLMPGVAHCGGGPGADRVDWIAALERWVEDEIAPEDIVATKTDAQGVQTLERKLCPFPLVALLGETGDKNALASYTCAVPGG